MNKKLTSLEICAGAGGQALGLEQAGFSHVALIEIEKEYCLTLKNNRPEWNVINKDIRLFDASQYTDIDLLSGGVPCPPFSRAGKQLGSIDERDLFPEAIRLTRQIMPKAVMLENVRGILDTVFDSYRLEIKNNLEALGYQVTWKLINASDFGVPQLRPRVVFIAIRNDLSEDFIFPDEKIQPKTVGETLYDLMAENGWKGAEAWRDMAGDIAPTIVGGSKKHGGPDLGPTRAKKAWAALGVDGSGIAYSAPEKDFAGMPKLTCRMVARIQGFPDEWSFYGKKTSTYRQIGNAFPVPVALSIGKQIKNCLIASKKQLLPAVGD